MPKNISISCTPFGWDGFSLLVSFALSFAGLSSGASISHEHYQKKPKLVVILVIDQFRADYLTRFQKRFVKPGQNGQPGGFNFLMEKGAYFPLAQYDVLQSMTCPGHAMIMTGSHPVLNGIPLNDWYDRQSKKIVYCAEDALDEISPRRLRTSTLGDELKNSGAKSKVLSIALKDRSAVMLGGHRADLALWMDYQDFKWRTSTYYRKDLPQWVTLLNQKLKAYGAKERTWQVSNKPTGLSDGDNNTFTKTYRPLSKEGLSLNYGTEVVFAAAETMLTAEALGKNSATDILAISLSNHDMLGHGLGPNSRDLEELTVFEDQRLSQFLKKVQSHLGSLKEVVIVLTADHGIPPTVEYSKKAKLDSGRLDYLALYRQVNEGLDRKFGSPRNKQWLEASKSLHFYLDQETLKEKSLDSKIVQAEMKIILTKIPGVAAVITADEVKNGTYPVGLLGEQARRQIIPEQSGDLIVIPRPFYMEKDDNQVTHMTGYSYDKTVPLIFYGEMFKPGVYASPARVIDLAPTLSFVLGLVPPATSEGRILDEIF